RVAGVGIAAVNAVAEDRHIGAALLGQHQQFVHGALEAIEHGLNRVADGIEEEDLGPHLVDRDQAARVHALAPIAPAVIPEAQRARPAWAGPMTGSGGYPGPISPPRMLKDGSRLAHR